MIFDEWWSKQVHRPRDSRGAAGDAWDQAAILAKERFKQTLSLHWLTNIECDHEAKTDTARCWCGYWTGTPQPSVAMAVQEWINHVMSHYEDAE